MTIPQPIENYERSKFKVLATYYDVMKSCQYRKKVNDDKEESSTGGGYGT
jgi:hypothetical protein